MSDLEFPLNGAAVTLTGDQIYTVRRVLKETQAQFGRRFAVSQPQIFRLESKRNEPMRGPLIILIAQLAMQYRVNLQKPITDRKSVEPDG